MQLLLEEIETERLLFRKIIPSDFNSWLPFYEDPTSTQFWEGLDKDPKIACENHFKGIFNRYNNNLGGMNALLDKESLQFIGMCGLLVQTVDTSKEIEIGYSILPKYRRLGYATEAAKKCKAYALKNKITNSIISIIHIDNIPSQKVAIANGMFLDKTTTYKNNPVHIYRVLL
ncbi:RimJ/RimL family protein N-acetyltransferase [Maribacter vaceletii]|uniref:RimJ/RimL family protein N-acetyltransferase n=1 Tax=Maribacter vaceletii TaxID=1206816 RepID=A0A495E646_9FLAO|nr:GNAT family N-acetyltransferase [Maribacter vaceletii]RKR12425.1 RimJ/RimL family protein N-acetyltransferase [Maribacter vaceletii]